MRSLCTTTNPHSATREKLTQQQSPSKSQLIKKILQLMQETQETWVPWVGKIPWRRKWQPTPLFLPVKYDGQRCPVSYSTWDHKRIGHDLGTKPPPYRPSTPVTTPTTILWSTCSTSFYSNISNLLHLTPNSLSVDDFVSYFTEKVRGHQMRSSLTSCY